MIPDEAVEAAARVLFESESPLNKWDWPVAEVDREEYRTHARAALEAAAPYIAAAALREAADQLEYGNPVGEFLEERAADMEPNALKGDEE